MNMLNNNSDRADRAQAALDTYISFTGDRPDESHIQDLITDLLHLVRREYTGEIQIPLTLRRAVGNFNEELIEEDEKLVMQPVETIELEIIK